MKTTILCRVSILFLSCYTFWGTEIDLIKTIGLTCSKLFRGLISEFTSIFCNFQGLGHQKARVGKDWGSICSLRLVVSLFLTFKMLVVLRQSGIHNPPKTLETIIKLFHGHILQLVVTRIITSSAHEAHGEIIQTLSS